MIKSDIFGEAALNLGESHDNPLLVRKEIWNSLSKLSGFGYNFKFVLDRPSSYHYILERRIKTNR